MTNFKETARLFEWKKGDKSGPEKIKSKWVEQYYGPIELDMEKLTICAADNKDVLNHEVQSSMNLKPAFNCERAWIYRLKADDGSETTYALRFKTKELAQEFQGSFVSSVDSVKAKEEEAKKEAEATVVEDNVVATPVEEKMDTTEEATPAAEEEKKEEEKPAEEAAAPAAEEEKKEEEAAPAATEEAAAPAAEEEKKRGRSCRPCCC